jgi:formylglycine-generating enzyme required for sulfatase activity
VAILATAGAWAQPGEKLDMVFIPAGEFEMGTSPEEVQRLAAEYDVHPSLLESEKPRRRVFVKAFLVDRYPVTNAEYKRFVDATTHQPPPYWVNGTYPEGLGDHPVTLVNPHGAQAYAAWAGKRLPTAEEWEKAARGTDGRLYPWGNEWNDHARRVDDPSCPQALPRTTPVGTFPAGASPYGVLDLCSNVAEWTATPATPEDKAHNWHWYVVKGAGGAHRNRLNFRCAARAFNAHESRIHNWLGFRCARDADAPPDNLAPPRPTPALPPPPTATGPDVKAFGKEPVQIIPGGPAGVRLQPPFLPLGDFGLYVPEQLGFQDLPLAWGLPHESAAWETNEQRTFARYVTTWKDKALVKVTLQAHADCVDLTITVKNLGGQTLTAGFSNVCFNIHNSPYFVDPERLRTMVWTDEGPVSLNRMVADGPGEPMHCGWDVAPADQPAPTGSAVRYPFIFIVSRDGNFTIAQAYAAGSTVASNAHYSCLHTRPVWPDIPPGEEREVKGKLYFLRGGPQELLARWKQDFGAK